MSDIRTGQDVGENKGSVTGVQRADADDTRQSVHIDFGSKSPGDIAAIIAQVPRLSNAVFGDGYSWVGVVADLRELKREVKSLIARMELLEKNFNILKEQLGERNETSQQMRWLLRVIAAGITYLVVVQLWPW